MKLLDKAQEVRLSQHIIANFGHGLSLEQFSEITFKLFENISELDTAPNGALTKILGNLWRIYNA